MNWIEDQKNHVKLKRFGSKYQKYILPFSYKSIEKFRAVEQAMIWYVYEWDLKTFSRFCKLKTLRSHLFILSIEKTAYAQLFYF